MSVLTESTNVDQIMINEDGVIHVRTATRVFRDGVEISKIFHRATLAPGNDPATIGLTDSRCLNVLAAVHDQDTIDKFAAKVAAMEAVMSPGTVLVG